MAELTEKLAALQSIPMGGPRTHDLQLVHRNFKITGTVGKPEEAGKFTYPSLKHQMDGAIRKGVDEHDIVDAVIRSIQPGIPLRTMLETQDQLTIVKFMIWLNVGFSFGTNRRKKK